VDEAIAERDRALESALSEVASVRERERELELVAARLSERVVARERELRALGEQLELMRGESDEAVRALTRLADELAAVRGQARGQATRIRLKALHDAAELSDRIAELARRPAEARERLLAALGDAIERLGADPEDPEPADAAPATNGHSPTACADDIWNGLVEVDVGPLSDFSQLVGFEDAAGAIRGTSDISVKRFTQGRATLELHLGEPVELLHELEARAPFEFHVRDTREGRVVLDVDAAVDG